MKREEKMKQIQDKIENAKLTLKEKVLFSLGVGMIVLGALGWGSSLVMAFTKVLSIPQMFAGLLGSCILTAGGMQIGTLGTNPAEYDEEEYLKESTKTKVKKDKEILNENVTDDNQYEK